MTATATRLQKTYPSPRRRLASRIFHATVGRARTRWDRLVYTGQLGMPADVEVGRATGARI